MSRTSSLILLVVFGVAACGSPQIAPKLKHRVDASHMAPVPAAERAAIVEAEQAVFLATWQIEYTNAELGIAKTELDVAKNDLAKAKLSAKTANTKQAHAEKVADETLVRAAGRADKLAVLEIDVAERNLERARERIEYLEARLEAERIIHRREEARVEHAKATSMTAAGVKPPKFDPKRYKAQLQERERRAKNATAKVQQRQAKLLGLEKKLGAARTALEQAKVAPAATPAVAPAPTEPPGGEVTTPPPGDTDPDDGTTTPDDGQQPPPDDTAPDDDTTTTPDDGTTAPADGGQPPPGGQTPSSGNEPAAPPAASDTNTPDTEGEAAP